MAMEYEPVDVSVKPKRSLLSLLLLPALAFIAGIAAMGWLLVRWTSAASFLGVAPQAAPPAAEAPLPVTVEAEPPALAEGSAPEPERLIIDPEMTRRVARLEQQLSDIGNQSRAAVGNADRAEGLLVAFAARRALDRGVALGYIEGLLRQRFEDTQRQAVATIITAARQPVTLQELQDGLTEFGPQLTGGGPNQDWWTAFKAELGGLVAIRKAGTPPPMPAERLRRATRQLEAGQVDVALAEVLRMPGRDKAMDWITKARRYVAARRALDTIETAALLEPRAGQSESRSTTPVRPPAAKATANPA